MEITLMEIISITIGVLIGQFVGSTAYSATSKVYRSMGDLNTYLKAVVSVLFFIGYLIAAFSVLIVVAILILR